MKHILIALMVVAIVGSASGLGLSDQVNVPTQAQLELIAKADSFSGKISKAHFVKGWGFGNAVRRIDSGKWVNLGQA